MPMVVKNAIINGDCSVVSKRNATTPPSRRPSARDAKRKPPMTGAGML